MKLPIPALPSDTLLLDGGAAIDYHSLSRTQAIQLHSYEGREDEAEDFLVACATGVTLKEAHAWRDSVTVEVGGQLVDAIVEISGLTREQLNGTEPDPKD